MSLIRWAPEYEVGDEQIDREHRELFAAINNFHDAWQEKQERGELVRLLSRLIDYAERHFRNEEKIMQEAGYPGAAEHGQLHEQLVDAVFALAGKIEDRSVNPTRSTVAFLRGWLTDHILQHDLAFKTFRLQAK